MSRTFPANPILRELALLLAYAVFLVLFTWPAVPQASSHYLAQVGGRYGGDALGGIVSSSRAIEAITQNKPFFEQAGVSYPFGLKGAAVYGQRPWVDLLGGALLQGLFGPVLGYNLLILLPFVLGGYFCYHFILLFQLKRVPAFLGGLAFAFSPYHSFVAQGWQELGQIQWFPLGGIALVLALREAKPKYFIATGLVYVLTFFSSLYYGYFLGLFIGLGILHEFYRMLRKESAIRLKGMALFCFILLLANGLVLWGLQPQLHDQVGASGDWARFGIEGFVMRAARPLDYLLPSLSNPYLGAVTQSVLDWWKPAHNRMDLYLGLGLIFFASFGLWKASPWTKEKKFLLGFSAFAFALTLVPYAQIGESKLYLPSYLAFLGLPMFKTLSRINPLLLLCLSVFFAQGVQWWGQKTKKDKLLLALVLLVFFVEYQNQDFNHMAWQDQQKPLPPAILQDQAFQSLVEYPPYSYLDVKTLLAQYRQMAHQRPIFNGSIDHSAANSYRIALENMSPMATVLLKKLGISHILFHKQDTQPQLLELVKKQAWGFKPLHEDDQILFAQATPQGPVPPAIMMMGAANPQGIRHFKDATLFIFSEADYPRATLRFLAKPGQRQIFLTIRRSPGFIVQPTVAPEGQVLQVPVNLKQGVNIYQFHSEPLEGQQDEITLSDLTLVLHQAESNLTLAEKDYLP